jgi:hypothetical protein
MAGTAKVLNPPSGSDGANAIKRRWASQTSACHATDLAECDSLDVRDYESLAVKPPAAATTITVHASETAAGTYVLVDNLGTNGVITCPASKWTTLSLAGLGFLKFFTSTAGNMVVTGK